MSGMASTDGNFLTQSRGSVRFAVIAVAVTAIGIGAFFRESYLGYGKPPSKLVYVESWPVTRTGAEAVREQNVRETARQAAIAQFEIERGEAMRARADSPRAKADAAAHIAANRAALAKWNAAHIEAQAVLAAHPAAALSPEHPECEGVSDCPSGPPPFSLKNPLARP